MSSNVSGQRIAYFEDTLHYCITEPVTAFLVSEHRKNVINKDKVITLSSERDSLFSAVDDLAEGLRFAEQALAAKDTVIAVKDEREDFAEQKKKGEGWRKIGKFFKDRWREVTIAGSALGVGFGVGYLAK